MKLALNAAFLVAIMGTAVAEPAISFHGKFKLADAVIDSCVSKCTSENASCKRTCPVTFSTPCLSACDSQAQFCRQGCQRR